ncbi:acetyl-CoA acetyltransferase [Plesiocystis pacifica SIR-1]|uniref:Acetyl-CoA acetyltransferase n=1 Tax=Plesiocystis pacifica SIR-1 TaxID=391625 RepID=A6GHQ9_9BACT|nr:acetyl-CoA acetyltransferase [Plesiocystis pacifica]EDM74601.1 acetyl-CoA acetyltransferase [Plesiocystis pacifica SIR-1]
MRPVYVLGGAQTDFARHWTREGLGLIDGMREAIEGTLEAAQVDAEQVQSVHVGNFAAERFADQGHLGGLVVEACPALEGRPSARHEAACASGSVALLAARAQLLAGIGDVALVLGVELMRNVPGRLAAQHLAPAAWAPHETEGVDFLWPQVFSDLAEVYARRYGLERAHLVALARQAFANAKRNPRAQTRKWTVGEAELAEDDAKNPVVAGRTRRYDCSQITDGAAGLILASEAFARDWASRRGVSLDAVPRILGVGHRTARMSFRGKLADAEASGSPYVFPQVRGCITDALGQAGLDSWAGLDLVETHDCFTSTFYMAIDHFGLTPPGRSGEAIDAGVVAPGGACPFNPSGGLIGLGHPVGATGVRMVLDLARQVRGEAGDCQVPGAKRAASLNIGGSATTSVCVVVGRG